MGAATVHPTPSLPRPSVSSHDCMCALETLYPRISAAITQLWFREEIDRYLHSLILDDRYGRRGFPIEVIDELLFLYDLSWALRHQQHMAETIHRDGDDFTFQIGSDVIRTGRRHPAADRYWRVGW